MEASGFTIYPSLAFLGGTCDECFNDKSIQVENHKLDFSMNFVNIYTCMSMNVLIRRGLLGVNIIRANTKTE